MKHALNNILEAIGETPLVKLSRISASGGINIYAKVEYFNPGLSFKDRLAVRFITAAEKSGSLQPGGTVIERTSGNMGIGLAIGCAVKGYKFIAVMSEGNSVERRRMLRALGAEVVLVPQAPGGKSGFVSGEDLELVELKAKELTEKLHAYRPNQFTNPDGPRTHEETTGEEIWTQMEGRIDAFVAYVGSGGTFTGVSRALKKHDKNVKCFVVEPDTAPYLAGKSVTSTRHRIQGGGYAFKPPFWDESLVDGYLTVSDEEAITYTREMARKEGIFAGYSSGANVAAALKLASLIGKGKNVVTLLPDSGLKYLSTDLFP